MSEAKKNNSNNKQKNSSATKKLITIELVVFAFLAVYLVGYAVSTIKKPKVNLEVVTYGRIDKPQVYNGIITRSEQATYAREDGTVYFNYNDNEYVRKDSVICVIRDNQYSGVLEKEISSMNENILKQQEFRKYSTHNENEIKRIGSKMKAATDSARTIFFTNNIEDAYNFKFQIQKDMELRNSIMSGESSPIINNLHDQKQAFEKQLQNSTEEYTAGFGGVLSYKVDGFEQTFTEEKLLDIEIEQIMAETTGSDRVIGDKNVKQNDPVFKIVDSNTWYISAYIDAVAVSDWRVGNVRDLYIEDSDKNKKVSMKVEHIVDKNENKYIVLSSPKYLTDFIQERYIKFCLNDSSFKGIKIPNTAITQKTTLKIHNDFVFEFRGSSGIYVKENNGYSFKSIDILSRNGDYCNVLQDFESIKLGTIAYKYSKEAAKVIENESYTIDELATTTGIYVANSGTAEFKQVNILTSNEYFSIIEKGLAYGVKPYDRIVSNAETVIDNQIIR